MSGRCSLGRAMVALAALALESCAGGGARSPAHSLGLPTAFASALALDATGAPEQAARAYLQVVRAAASAEHDPWQLPALAASLDALATRTMPSLGDAARHASLAYRTAGGVAAIAAELRADAAEAKGPYARGLLARALMALAEHDGDAAEAARERAASGCATEAVVVGPLSWLPVTGAREPDSLGRPGTPLAASYETGGAFGGRVRPVEVTGRGCRIDLDAESPRPGVRDVIVDVDVPSAQTVGVALRAHGAARLHAAGLVAVDRPFDLGDGDAARFVTLAAEQGVLRLVARVGSARDDDWVEIDAFDAAGRPLTLRAPQVGSVARAAARQVPAPAAGATTDEETLLLATSDMALGDPRTAERRLRAAALSPHARPDIALAYARAVETARDLSLATRAERARAAYENVLAAWPTSWEATIAHAVLAGARRGREEAGVETLKDLNALRAEGKGGAAPLLDAFEALIDGEESLYDRAREALTRAQPFGQTTLGWDAREASVRREGPERVAADCATHPEPRDTFACYDALRAAGDRGGQTRELERLRTLLGAPQRFLPLELHEALAQTDRAAAARAYGSMLPAERTLGAFGAIFSQDRAKLEALAPTARDAPGALGALLAAESGGDWDAAADRVVAQDRAGGILRSAATAVLMHDEHYDVSDDGLLHFTLVDVRRVSGTTDVDENAQAAAPSVLGRTATQTLRRRILKKDGRVVEPDRAPLAEQAHADLSQLEQGDAVESVYEGYALPSDSGDIGIDTPDLLPYRAAVHEASIEVRIPARLRPALWSHPLLGHPVDRAEDGRRVLTWRLGETSERRIEDGTPRTERPVAVSLSTLTWSTVGRALGETLATLEERDPEIGEWARRTSRTAPPGSVRAVEAIVAASGEALHEGDPGALSDYGGGIAPTQMRTARGSLASHEGSRSWLVLRALRELGISSDLVVAEDEPFSSDPAYPPHYARFTHPLVVAHVADGKVSRDVWIDADVSGPPLPAGRVSPELRGRQGLRADGSVAPLPGDLEAGAGGNEVDVRLTIDDHGNARGTLVAALQGREAQELAEALFRTVGAQRQRALRDVVLAWLPWANVDDVKLASAEGSWEVRLRAEVSVSAYAQVQGDGTWRLPGMDALHLTWPRARVSSLGAAFAARADRETPLAVTAAAQYHVHRRVELPPGAVVLRLPGPIDKQGALVHGRRDVGVEASAVEEQFSLTVSTGTVEVADYPAFVAAAHAVDDAFLASAVVRPP